VVRVKVKSRDPSFVTYNPIICREAIAASLREGPGAFIVLPDQRSIQGDQVLWRHERMKGAEMTVFLRKINQKLNDFWMVFGCFFVCFPILSLSYYLENIPNQSEKVPNRSKNFPELPENTA
jgi:hypothetical protein